jgi:hypothetical protein
VLEKVGVTSRKALGLTLLDDGELNSPEAS